MTINILMTEKALTCSSRCRVPVESCLGAHGANKQPLSPGGTHILGPGEIILYSTVGLWLWYPTSCESPYRWAPNGHALNFLVLVTVCSSSDCRGQAKHRQFWPHYCNRQCNKYAIVSILVSKWPVRYGFSRFRTLDSLLSTRRIGLIAVIPSSETFASNLPLSKLLYCTLFSTNAELSSPQRRCNHRRRKRNMFVLATSTTNLD